MKELTEQEKRFIHSIKPYIEKDSYVLCEIKGKKWGETLSKEKLTEIIPNWNEFSPSLFRKKVFTRFGVGEFTGFIINPKAIEEPVLNRTLAVAFQEPYEGPTDEEEYEFINWSK